MNDERLSELLATHAGPAAVDDAFEDRLYSILQREMRPGRSSRPALLLAAALLLAITIIGAVAVGSGLIEPPWVNPSPTPTRMPTSAPVALKDGPLQAGTYVANPFPAPNDSLAFRFNVPDGWEGYLPGAVAPTAGTEGPAGAGVDFLRGVTTLNYRPCGAGISEVGPSSLDLAIALEEQTGYEATSPVDVRLGAYSGQRMDLLMPSGVDFSACANGGYLIWDGAPYVQGPGARWHLWILDVEWERVVILAHDFATTSPQIQAELLAIVESIRIEPPIVHAWPGPGENPPGQYSWASDHNPNVGRQGWMHNGYQTLGEGQSVSVTFALSGEADEDGPTAASIAGYPGTYQELIRSDGARTELWIVEIEGTRVTITVEAEPNTTAAQLAEVDAMIESIRYEATETDGFVLTFTLPFGWDSG